MERRLWLEEGAECRRPSLVQLSHDRSQRLVRPVHAKAMPVVLRSDVEIEEWLGASADQIEAIQSRVLPTEALEIVFDDEAAQYVGGYIK